MKSKLLLEMVLLALDDFKLNELVECFDDEGKFLERYFFEEPDGFCSIECARCDSLKNILLLTKYLFSKTAEPTEIFKSANTIIFDLTELKSKITTPEDMENWYQDWIKESDRDNSMDEYGQLIGLIGYVQRHLSKNHLLLIVIFYSK